MYPLDIYRYLVGFGGGGGGACDSQQKNALYLYSHSWHFGYENVRLAQIFMFSGFTLSNKIFLYD